MSKTEYAWVIQRDDGKFFYDIGIVDDYSPYFCDDILICLLNGGRFKARKDAQIYINKFLQNCRPARVKIEIIGEDDE